MHVHDDENATTEPPKVDQLPNNEAPINNHSIREKQSNDVPRDWRRLHDHPKDQILSKTIDPLRTRPSL